MNRTTARDVMTPDPLVVREDSTVSELASFLLDNEISGAPVVGSRGDLVGVVSLADVARAANEQGDVYSEGTDADFYLRGQLDDLETIHGWEESYDREDVKQLHVEGEGALVRDIMSPRVLTVDEGTSVSEIAEAMTSGHYHRLLVTRDDKLVGIVTSLDLLKLIAQGKS